QTGQRLAGGRERVIAGWIGEGQRLGLHAGGDVDGAEAVAGETGVRCRRVRHDGREPVGRRVPVGAGTDPRLAHGEAVAHQRHGGRDEYAGTNAEAWQHTRLPSAHRLSNTTGYYVMLCDETAENRP